MRISVKPKIHKLAIDVKAKADSELNYVKKWRSDHPTAAKQPIEQFCDEDIWERSRIEPIYFEDSGLSFYFGDNRISHGFLYQNVWYWVEGKFFTREQKKLLVMEDADKERIYFEKLAMKFTSDAAREALKPLDRIPEEVKIAVWRRDEGRCANPDCRRKEGLEYHHIIPRTKGGSSTVRNVELLCETCNRKQGNRIDELPLSY